MSDLSVIGTGVMGSALVDALAASGAEVTAWNRTKEKAEALSGPGVHLADSVAGALTASPLTILSVSDQELARTLVQAAGVDLTGKVVASASFVTPDQGRAFDAAVSAAGGSYLDLSIPAYPSEVRSRAGVFLISGDHAAYEEHRERFERIGRASWVNDSPGAAYVSEMALLLAYLPMAVGLLQGLRMCQRLDLPVQWFHQTVLELYPFHIRSLLSGSPRRRTRRQGTWRHRSTSGGRRQPSMPTPSGIWASTPVCTTRCTGCSPRHPKPVAVTPTGHA